MIIDFYNRGGGSGGGVTSGEVETMIENKQNLYTASTKDDLTGLTDSHEGDVALVSSYNRPLSWYDNAGNSVGEIDYWFPLAGSTVFFGFNWDFYQEYYDTLSGQTLWATVYYSDENWNYQYFQIKDEAGTLYYSTGSTTENWVSWDGNPIAINIPTGITQMNLTANIYDFGIQGPEELILLTQLVQNAVFQKNEGEWIRLEDYFVKTDELSGYLQPIRNEINSNFSSSQKYYQWKPYDSPSMGEDATVFMDNNKSYEVFKQADKFVERKGVYNRSVNVTALINYNDAEEGDVALVSTVSGTATTHTQYTYNEGKWVMPVVSDEINKIKVIDVVGFGLITEKDPKTLYNVVESERVIAADPVSIVLENSGGSATVNVYALDTYTVSGDSFFTVSGTPASGLTTLTISATGANQTSSVITGSCTLTCSGSTVEITVTQKKVQNWVPLSSITNADAVDAIAWGENYYSERIDNWLSEVSGLTSEDMGWNDGTNAGLGWFADHRWNNTYFAFRWEHTEGSWADDVDRSNLPEETIDVNGSSVSVHVYDFANVQNAVPLYPAYFDGSLYGSDVYVRTV